MASHILIVHYSRNGYTARLADALAAELQARGARVTRECVRPVPLLPLYVAWAEMRRWWHGV